MNIRKWDGVAGVGRSEPETVTDLTEDGPTIPGSCQTPYVCIHAGLILDRNIPRASSYLRSMVWAMNCRGGSRRGFTWLGYIGISEVER